MNIERNNQLLKDVVDDLIDQIYEHHDLVTMYHEYAVDMLNLKLGPDTDVINSDLPDQVKRHYELLVSSRMRDVGVAILNRLSGITN